MEAIVINTKTITITIDTITIDTIAITQRTECCGELHTMRSEPCTTAGCICRQRVSDVTL